MIAALFAFFYVATAVAASAPSPAKKPAVQLAVKKPARKPGHKAVVKKTVVPKPEIRSLLSLEGQVFNRTRGGDRLMEDDAARYAHIFAFQDVGHFRKANEEIKKLKDHRLMGHVLYQRYAGRDYKATYRELAVWMKAYNDHPGAQKIYALAQNRRPQKGGGRLTEVRPGKGIMAYHDYDSGQLASPYMASQELTKRERDIMAEISRNLSENPTKALNRLESPEVRKIFSATKYDALRAQISESYFYNGNANVW